MASIVAGVVAVARELRQAFQNAPLLAQRCEDFTILLGQISSLAEQLEGKAQTRDGRDFFEKLQAALKRALKIVKQGQGEKMRTYLFLLSNGDNFAKALETEFQNIQLYLNNLNLLNTRQLIGIAETGQETKELCRRIEASQDNVLKFLHNLVKELSLNRSQLGGLARESRHAIARGDFDRSRVAESVIDSLVGDGTAGGCLGYMDREELRMEWIRELRGGGGGASGSTPPLEYEPDEKDGQEGALLVNDVITELFKTLEVLSETKQQVEKERAAKGDLEARVMVLERDTAAAAAALQDDRVRHLEEELKAAQEKEKQWRSEVQVANRRYELTTTSHLINSDLKLFYDRLQPTRGRAGESAAGPSVDTDDNYPSAFICVICHEPMQDPVVLSSGKSCCEGCAQELFRSSGKNSKCPVTQKDIHNSYTDNDNLRLVQQQWVAELFKWKEKQEKLLHEILAQREGALAHNDVDPNPPTLDQTVPVATNIGDDEKDPEVNEEVQRLFGGHQAKGAAGLKVLLLVNRGRWKQVYTAGAFGPLIEALREPRARRTAICVLELVMNEAVKEALKRDGVKAGIDACQTIAEEARTALAHVLNDQGTERQVKAASARILGHCCVDKLAMKDLILGSDDDEVGIILGLVQLSISKKGEDETEDEHSSIQEHCRQTLARLAEMTLPSPSSQRNTIPPLLKLTASSANRVESMTALAWLAKEAAREGDAGWVVEALVERSWHESLPQILAEATDSAREKSRLPLAECLASLCEDRNMAARIARPLNRAGARTGLDSVLDLLSAVVGNIESERPTLDDLACAGCLIRVLTSVAMLEDTAESRIPLLDRGVELLLRVLSLSDRGDVGQPTKSAGDLTAFDTDVASPSQGSGQGAWPKLLVAATQALEKLAETAQFADAIVQLGGVEVLAALLHQDVGTAEAAMGALSNLLSSCPTPTASALNNSGRAFDQICKLLRSSQRSCRHAAVNLLCLLAQRGGESCEKHIARVLSFDELKPRDWDSGGYKRSSSSLGASLAKHWGSEEDVAQALAYMLDLLSAALKDPCLKGAGQERAVLTGEVKMSDGVLGTLSDLLVMLEDASKTELVIGGLLERADDLIRALDCNVAAVSLRATELVARLTEAVVQLADWERVAPKMEAFVVPLLAVLLSKPKAPVGATANGNGAASNPDQPPSPQHWAHHALALLIWAAPETPWISDDQITVCIKTVLGEPTRFSFDRAAACRLLHTVYKEQRHRAELMREGGLMPRSKRGEVPVVDAAESLSTGEARTVALELLCLLARDAPELFVEQRKAACRLAALLSDPDPKLQRMAASALAEVVKNGPALESFARYDVFENLLKPLKVQDPDRAVEAVVVRLLYHLSSLNRSLLTNECADAVIGILLAPRADSKSAYRQKQWCLSILQNFVDEGKSELLGSRIHAHDAVGYLGSLLATSHTQGQAFGPPGKETSLLGNSAAYLLSNCMSSFLASPRECIGLAQPLSLFLRATRHARECCLQAVELAKALWSTNNLSVQGELAGKCETLLKELSVQGCPAKGTERACSRSPAQCDKEAKPLATALSKVSKEAAKIAKRK